MTPHDFIAKWKDADLSERAACQQHFLDLCELLGQPKPAEADPDRRVVHLREGRRHKRRQARAGPTSGSKGYFGWEYKGKHKDLDAAYQQLLQYREDLENPPLLVVCDLDRFEVHTNFTGTAKTVHAFDLERPGRPAEPRRSCGSVFTDPDRAASPAGPPRRSPRRSPASFARLADGLRGRGVDRRSRPPTS